MIFTHKFLWVTKTFHMPFPNSQLIIKVSFMTIGKAINPYGLRNIDDTYRSRIFN